MHHHYEDILSLTDEEPKWFDENAVPRFCEFSPAQVANIYADVVVLLEIKCQACGRPFKVAHSINEPHHEIFLKNILPDEYDWDDFMWGDPPNMRCCPAGPTMQSVDTRPLQIWIKNDEYEWEELHHAKA